MCGEKFVVSKKQKIAKIPYQTKIKNIPFTLAAATANNSTAQSIVEAKGKFCFHFAFFPRE
jgi:hypothetical protein